MCTADGEHHVCRRGVQPDASVCSCACGSVCAQWQHPRLKIVTVLTCYSLRNVKSILHPTTFQNKGILLVCFPVYVVFNIFLRHTCNEYIQLFLQLLIDWFITWFSYLLIKSSFYLCLASIPFITECLTAGLFAVRLIMAYVFDSLSIFTRFWS